MKLFSVFDKKGNYFQRPLAADRNIDAIRGFETAVNDTRSEFNRYPSDFALYFVGDFDEDTGKIIQPEIPHLLVDALSLLPSKIVDGSEANDNDFSGTRPAAKERQL